MSIRPLFCLAAFPKDERGLSCNFADIRAYMQHMEGDPRRTAEFEWAMESVVRNNGLDPSTDTSWQSAGIAGGRAEVATLVREHYLKSVPLFLNDLRADIAYNPDDYVEYNPKQRDWTRTPLGPSGLEHAYNALERAFCETDTDVQTDDAPWIEAGIDDGLQGLRAHVHEIFVRSKVGGHMAGRIGDICASTQQQDVYARACADALIRQVMPRAADVLGIAQENHLLNTRSSPALRSTSPA